MPRPSFGLLLLFLLGGCGGLGTRFPVAPSAKGAATSDAGIPYTVVPVTAANAARLSPAPKEAGEATGLPKVRGWQYRVGVGDILSVLVYDHPELTLPAGPQRSAAESGQPVEGDGTFFYPYVGKVKAAGLRPAGIRRELTAKLARYIPDPQVDVHVAAYNAQGVSVTGEVKQPGREPLTLLPLTLLRAVDAAGGLTAQADAANVSVRRGGRSYRVDLRAFLEAGRTANNPVLIDGDVVNVPLMAPVQAYLLGRVRRPAPIDLSKAPVTLTAALTQQGGLTEPDADPRGVFVFRKPEKGPIRVYRFDARSPMAFVAGAAFYLRPGDVIFVMTSGLERWREVITSVLPFVATVNQGTQAGQRL